MDALLRVLKALGALVITLLTPTQGAMLTVVALGLIDLITGIIASLKDGRPITSSGIKRTVLKLMVYEIAIVCSFVVERYLTGPDMPIMRYATTLIGLTEFKSILENLDMLAGGNMFRVLVDRLQGIITSSKDDTK